MMSGWPASLEFRSRCCRDDEQMAAAAGTSNCPGGPLLLCRRLDVSPIRQPLLCPGLRGDEHRVPGGLNPVGVFPGVRARELGAKQENLGRVIPICRVTGASRPGFLPGTSSVSTQSTAAVTLNCLLWFMGLFQEVASRTTTVHQTAL